MKTIEKARRLKDEFEQLPYSEKLKFMDEHFNGVSAVEDENGVIISIKPDRPDENGKILPRPEEMTLYNKRFEQTVRGSKYARELFFDSLVEDAETKIKEYSQLHQYPKPYIQEYLKKQLNDYESKIKRYGLDLTKVWDLSKEKIDLNYFYTQAWPQYIEYLTEKLATMDFRSTKKKECKAPAVARAFYMCELLKCPKYSDVLQSDRKKIKEIARKEFPEKNISVITILQYLTGDKTGKGIKKGIFHNFDKYKASYPDEFEYGMKLLKENHPEYSS